MAMLIEGILMIVIGLFFVVAGLWEKREAENADGELIERKAVIGERYVTRQTVYKGAVWLLMWGVIFLLVGIITILTQRLFGIFPFPQ